MMQGDMHEGWLYSLGLVTSPWHSAFSICSSIRRKQPHLSSSNRMPKGARLRHTLCPWLASLGHMLLQLLPTPPTSAAAAWSRCGQASSPTVLICCDLLRARASHGEIRNTTITAAILHLTTWSPDNWFLVHTTALPVPWLCSAMGLFPWTHSWTYALISPEMTLVHSQGS
jgi:hypothetical protein